MHETESRVQTYKVVANCECGGIFKFTGIKLLISPPKFTHICDNCNKKEDFKEIYPLFRYKQLKIE